MATALALADPACGDPSVTGAKAARLAQALAAGLPALPGMVVPAARSRRALADGFRRIASAGPHGAQLQVMEADTGDLAELAELTAKLGDPVVVRSSSPLEGSGHWAGAFTSYLDVPPAHVLTAVRGVWASALGRDALERGDHLGAAQRAPEIAVLVQPRVRPDFSGTAHLDADGTVTVVAVDGDPAPLLHGWEPGWVCYRATDGAVHGDSSAFGHGLVHAVADLVTETARRLGDDRIEWASVGGQLVLLQSTTGQGAPAAAERWSAGDTPAGGSLETAYELLGQAADRTERMRAERLAYAAVMEHGERVTGVPAAPGIGAGPVVFVEGVPTGPSPLPAGRTDGGAPARAVLVAPRPLPHLAPLLWGASGLVTFGGSPASHLVEVARSLNLPAVVGCRSTEPLIRAGRDGAVAAVDGHHGVVSTHVPVATPG